jgi:hypothetical protein
VKGIQRMSSPTAMPDVLTVANYLRLSKETIERQASRGSLEVDLGLFGPIILSISRVHVNFQLHKEQEIS